MSKERYYGIYRARVNEVDIDDNKYGAVRVYIPHIHSSDPNLDPAKDGIIAYPGNSPLGGSDDETEEMVCSVYVPGLKSLVWVFFEDGYIERPFYLSSFNFEHSELPPENKKGEKGSDTPHKVYSLFRSYSGRRVIISDSDDCQRVEITGKNYGSDDSPKFNSILIDEKKDSEKILISTSQGDYICIDIPNRCLNLSFAGGVHFDTGGESSGGSEGYSKNPSSGSGGSGGGSGGNGGPISFSGGDIDIKSKGNIGIEAKQDMSIKGGGNASIVGGITANLKSDGMVCMDGMTMFAQSMLSCQYKKANITMPSWLSGSMGKMQREMSKLQDAIGSATGQINSAIESVSGQLQKATTGLENMASGIGGQLSGGLSVGLDGISGGISGSLTGGGKSIGF